MEMEMYADYLNEWLKHLAGNKPDDLRAMEITLDHSPATDEYRRIVKLYSGIEKVAEALHRPLRIEITSSNHYRKVVVFNGLIFTELRTASPLNRRKR